ncbi:HDOD domain-containing protein [bacterium]|jgi:HD-like signal output (HDOD) protein|nr:HDOD domain-containing protein [bacterium]
MASTLQLTNLKLPTLPVAAMKVLELVQDPDVDVQSLGKVIEYDPAMAARLVRLANSSLFGLTREISSVRQALVILGLRTVKLAALSFTLLETLVDKSGKNSLAHCWRSIITNAMASRLLAPLFKIDPEEAFLAGLMQDIGGLICAQSFGPKYLEFVEKAKEECNPDISIYEQKEYGFTHTDVSVQLLEHWRLPSRIIEAVREHEQVDLKVALEEKRQELSLVLATSDAITSFLLKPSTEHLDRFVIVADGFGDSASEIDKFVQKLEMQVDEMAELLELKLPSGVSYEDVAAKARELSKDLRVEGREQLPLRVRQELARSQRENSCLALVLLRVTTASQLAKAGHNDEAEKLQRSVARMLQEITRESDALFRLNLSTFCVLATSTPMEGVETMVQRLIPKLQKATVTLDGQEVPAKFAFGVVVRSESAPADVNVESFLLKANDNLADAVQKGEFLSATTL